MFVVIVFGCGCLILQEMPVILGSNGLVCNCVENCMIIARAETTLVVAMWWCFFCVVRRV